MYRCCDVNDLIGNTLGGWLGYVFTPLFTCFLPSRERLNQVSYQRGSRVSYVRRGFAFLVDAGVEVVVAAPLWLILPLGQRSALRQRPWARPSSARAFSPPCGTVKPWARPW